MQEKQVAELALQKKLEEEHAKRQQEKQRRKEEHMKEEEMRKQLEDAEKEQHKAEAIVVADDATAQLVSPSEPNPKDMEMEEPDLNKNLF
jgi:hypothetical protein